MGKIYCAHPNNQGTLTDLFAIMRDQDAKAVITSTGGVETYVTANIGNYDIPLTKQGTASGVYDADVPAGLATGRYNVFFYQGSVAEGSYALIGTQEYEEPFYMVDGCVTIDDEGLEDLYGWTWLKNGVPITTNGAITSQTIQVFDDDGDLIASTNVTDEVGSSESWEYSAVNAERMAAGQRYRCKITATIDGSARTSGFWVNRDRTSFGE